MAHRNKIFFGALVTLIFMAVGTAGYALIENYTVLDALYMTVITITTVGFGEVQTLTEAGRIFTIFLILFGFGSIGFLAHAFTEAIIERAASKNLGKKTMQKRIKQLQNHVIICGFGRVGEAAAEYFASTGSEFIVIETSEEQLKLIEDYNYIYMEGDATREDTLLAAGIKKAGALVALLDSDPENLFTVLTARELNPTLHIIARTEIATSESRMLRAGADSIISPYAYAGRKVAETILSTTEEAPIQSVQPDKQAGPIWFEVTEQSDLAGHVVETAKAFLSGDILGIRREEQDILQPHPEEKILLGDVILLSHYEDSKQSSQASIHKSKKKILFIDDNPVIRRLYTRLFQKAGFIIKTAQNGEEGYRLAIEETPDAAVVDFELPDISGLEVCSRFRENKDFHRMKLFLFTANEDNKTRETALQAGVDTVVIKSPEAGEIVNTVKAQLNNA